MTTPTQQLPPWLSFSTATLTNAAGTPSVSSSLVFLPLTYYGPSVPLGTLFTYGGLTSPASTVSSPATTVGPSPSSPSSPAIPPSSVIPSSLPSSVIPSSLPSSVIPPSSLSSSSAIPSSTSVIPSLSSTISLSSTAVPSSTAIPSSLSSIPSSLPTVTVVLPTPSSSVTASPIPNSFSNSNRNAIVAIVLGAILGSVLILLLGLLFIRWRVRRNRDQHPSEFSFEAPVWADWSMVERNGQSRDPDPNRPAGEGIPRETGDEIDPFLTHVVSTGPEATNGEGTGPTARLVTPESPIVGQALQAGVAGAAANDDISEGSSARSGYGTLLERFPTDIGGRRGHIMSPEDLLKVDTQQGSSTDNPQTYSALPPPPSLDSDRIVGFARIPLAQKPSQRLSHISDADEAALLTARRVRIQEVAASSRPHPSTASQPPSAGPSGIVSGLGGAFAGLRSLSWFKNRDVPSRPSSYVSQALSDQEIEAGKALLSNVRKSPSRTEFGVGPDGGRPMSTVSTKSMSGVSGNTVYHDAPSSLRGTPELAPLPRAWTPSQGNGEGSGNENRQALSLSRPTSGVGYPPVDPPAYEYPSHILDMHSPTQTNINLSFPPPGVDILDIPAPPPASPFGSASPWGSSSSSRGSMANLPFPPGLALLTAPRPWLDSSDGSGSGSPSYGTGGGSNSDGVAVDVLEEDPPSAVDRWRSLAGVSEGPRRTTFGWPQLVHPAELTTSEQGSLHSRSHLSPQSSGSAPASGLHILSASGGSASSRPSGHSAMSSGNSRGSPAQGSVASDGRWRIRGLVTTPSMSAVGGDVSSGSRPVNEHGYLSPYPSPPHSPVALVPAHMDTVPSVASQGTGTARAVGTIGTGTDTTRTETTGAGTGAGTGTGTTQVTSEPGSSLLGLASVPWAGGLDSDWNPK